jgi:arginyl-tRNA synthetase
MATFTQQLTRRLTKALTALGHDDRQGKFIPVVTAAANTRHGDYQTNAAMALAKPLKINPRELASQLIEKIDVTALCDVPEIAGPGFINFRISKQALATRISSLINDKRLGVDTIASTKRLLIDFSSPNVAKPMHIGHIRSTIIGDCLARTARFLGHDVVADNHIGDWGTPMGQVLYGWKNHLDQSAFSANPIKELLRLYQLVKQQAESSPEIAGTCLKETVKLQSGNVENLALWKQFIEITMAGAQDIYQRLDIQFDTTLGESFYDPHLAPLVENLLANGIARESDGAICVFSNNELAPKEDPLLVQRDGQWVAVPCLIRKKDGGFNYATTDIATIDYRLNEQKVDEILYVVDDRQSLHFRQLFEVARQRGITTSLKHIAFGKILGDDRKPFKTREGTVPALGDVINEAVERARKMVNEKNSELSAEQKSDIAERIGVAAVKYAELSQARASDYVFSWEKMLALQGNTAPYMINAYVRTRAIFRKLEDIPRQPADELSITEDTERIIAMKLCQYGEVLPEMLCDYRPNLLATYLYELAQNFHSFYEQCPVLNSQEPVRCTRIALCDTTSRILKHGLNLLGITPPERM